MFSKLYLGLRQWAFEHFSKKELLSIAITFTVTVGSDEMLRKLWSSFQGDMSFVDLSIHGIVESISRSIVKGIVNALIVAGVIIYQHFKESLEAPSPILPPAEETPL